MLAVIPVRDGTLPLGAAECVAEAQGVALVVGSGTEEAARSLGAVGRDVRIWEAGPYLPNSWSASLPAALDGISIVVLPASPDGRDLAPRLAAVLGWPLFAPALAVSPTAVTVIRGGGLRTEEYRPNGPFVATLQPGVRGVEIPDTTPAQAQVIPLDLAAAPDAEPAGELAADPATVGLADAKRIVAAGAGLGSREMVQLTADVATALGASFGATRVVTDAGWAPIDRQIGTTGVVVDPDLYVALGISGAVQHVSGIGRPATVVAANTDASCPMMGLADLALVTDATALLRELATRLGVPVPQVQEARRG